MGRRIRYNDHLLYVKQQLRISGSNAGGNGEYGAISAISDGWYVYGMQQREHNADRRNDRRRLEQHQYSGSYSNSRRHCMGRSIRDNDHLLYVNQQLRISGNNPGGNGEYGTISAISDRWYVYGMQQREHNIN